MNRRYDLINGDYLRDYVVIADSGNIARSNYDKHKSESANREVRSNRVGYSNGILKFRI